jgi:ssDNA-specific exonuclease RecJ
MLITYGGHSQAAGVAVEKDRYLEFYDAFEDYVNSVKTQEVGEKTYFADMLVEGPISMKFAKEIEAMEPFGVGNRRPLFAIKVGRINSQRLKNGSAHFSYKTKALEMLDFNGENNVKPLSMPIEKTVLFELNLSTYKSREWLKGYVRHVEVTEENLEEILPFVLDELLEEIKGESSNDSLLQKINKKGLTIKDFIKELSTDRSDFGKVFNELLSLCGKQFQGEGSFASQYFEKEERLQAVFALKVFIELGIFEVRNGYLTYRENIKNALTNSKVYSKIYAERDAYVGNI